MGAWAESSSGIWQLKALTGLTLQACNCLQPTDMRYIATHFPSLASLRVGDPVDFRSLVETATLTSLSLAPLREYACTVELDAMRGHNIHQWLVWPVPTYDGWTGLKHLRSLTLVAPYIGTPPLLT